MKNGLWVALTFAVCLLSGGAVFAEEGTVVRGVYTSGVQDRKPVDELTTLPKDLSRLYFFTELRNLAGQTVTHRWEQGGKVMLEVPFEVKAARWRVWSSKEIQPNAAGEWSVVVVDQNGKDLKRSSITVGQ